MPTALHQRAIETQNRTWAQMQEIQQRAEAEVRDLSAEERQAWDTAEADLTRASEDIERFERLAHLDSIDRSQIITTSPRDGDDAEASEARYAEAFGLYLRRGLGRMAPEHQALMEARFSELRDQGAGTDTLGGYLVPEGFRATLVETMRAYGGLLAEVEVVTTATGQDLPWPTNDDTGNEGEIIGENTQVSQQDITLGSKKLKAHIFSSKMVKVSLALLQDSAFDLNTWLPRKLGERIGRRAARAWTTGTGIDQPEGITANITVGRQGANGQTTSIIYDDLLDLEHSVDPAYRMNAAYALHDLSLKVIRKLKDGQQRPLWQPVPAAGFPATINGIRYVVDNSMPQMAASAKPIVFGDLRAGYIVRQVLGVQNLRLTERFADFLQVGFLGFARMDGMVQDGAAIRAYQNSAV